MSSPSKGVNSECIDTCELAAQGHDFPPTAGRNDSLVEQSDFESIMDGPSRKRRKLEVENSSSCGQLSPVMWSSLPSTVLTPPTDSALTVALILHQHMLSVDAVRDILQARNKASMDEDHASIPEEMGVAKGSGGCLMIGTLVLGLGGPLDVGAVLREGGSNLQLSLVLQTKEEGSQWLLRLKVGDRTEHLEVKMDARLAKAKPLEVSKILQKTAANAVRLFLVGNGCGSRFNIEVWSLWYMRHSGGGACELGGKLPHQPLYTALVGMLSDDDGRRVAEDDRDGGNEGRGPVVTEVKKFYEDVRQRQKVWLNQKTDTLSPVSLVPGLLATLRGYQAQALGWMLHREGVVRAGLDEAGGGGAEDQLHPLWRKLPCDYGSQQQLYFNPYVARFSPVFFPAPASPRGGILADEMGLGKTVEVLALILQHRRNDTSSQHVSGSNSDKADFLQPVTNLDAVNSTSVEEMEDGGGRSGGVVSKGREGGVVSEGQNGGVVGEGQNGGVVGEGQNGGVVGEVQVVCVMEEESVVREEKEEAVDTSVRGEGQSKEEEEECVECLCGSRDGEDEQEWVECERCRVWQHVSCSDYSEEESITFICIKCLLKEPYKCKATLVICPRAICHQWKEEIAMHTYDGTLRVMTYQGVSKKYVSPLTLANCDVVLASYEVLCSELYHVTSIGFNKKLRHPKRFSSYPSPLTAVQWWRIVLDEAQMVESRSVRAAEMVGTLSAVNRWCVSGTPIQKDLRDLYGLLFFLKVDPYHTYQWYKQLLWTPFLQGQRSPMIDVFSDLMWRNSKVDVAEELQLLPQTEHVYWVSFRSVEEYYYGRQREACLTRLTSWSWPADKSLSSLSHSAMIKLLTPLHSLRQACCTPGIVKSGYLPQDLTRKGVVTMDYLLSKLSQQAKVEARESLRQLVSTLNGLAGLHSLNAVSLDEKYDAMCCYREAIDMWEEYRDYDVDCDKLQRIHTLENLVEMMECVKWPTLPSREEYEERGSQSVLDRAEKEDAAEDASPELHDVDGWVEEGRVCDNNEGCNGDTASDGVTEGDMEEDEEELHTEDNERRRGTLATREDGRLEEQRPQIGPMEDQRPALVSLEEDRPELASLPSLEDQRPEPVSLEDQIPEPASLEDQRPEPASLEDQRPEPVSLEDQRPEPVSLEDQRPEPVSLEEQRPEPVSLEEQPPEPVSLEDQRPEPVSLEEQPPEPVSLEEQRPEPVSLEEQRPEVTSMEDQRPEQISKESSSHNSSANGTTEHLDDATDGLDKSDEEEKLVLRNDILMNEARRLREAYIKKENENVQVAMDLVRSSRHFSHTVLDKVQQSQRDALHLPPSIRDEDQSSMQWLTSALMWFKSSLNEEAAMEYLRGVCPSLSYSLSRFTSLQGMLLDISFKIKDLESDREWAWQSLVKVFDSIHSDEMLCEAISCHLDRPSFRICDKCELCASRHCLSMCEGQLFSSYGEVATERSRLPALLEQSLKELLHAVKRKRAPEALVSTGQTFMSYLEAIRKEYPVMQQLWVVMECFLGKRYELTQASTRLQLNGDYRAGHRLGLFVDEIPRRMAQWSHEKIVYLAELRKHVGQIVYLKNLEAQHKKSSDCCPICTCEVGQEIGMFPCGHSVCVDCLEAIANRRLARDVRRRVSCPLCREVCFSHAVHRVLLGSKHESGVDEEEEEEEKVENVNHTSKILAVVRTLLRIRRKEPAAKALVFSWWSEVLAHISQGLGENYVPHVLLTQQKFQAQLTAFKRDPNTNILLLPFKSGSKGLNIVEATHVLLVEPQLNLGTEVQAIGRIHRIGQTKPTTVHRFIVRGTVEEHICNWTKRDREEQTVENTLLECDSEMTCEDVKRLLTGGPCEGPQVMMEVGGNSEDHSE